MNRPTRLTTSTLLLAAILGIMSARPALAADPAPPAVVVPSAADDKLALERAKVMADKSAALAARYAAGNDLIDMGPRALAAAPDLLRIAGDAEVGRKATESLAAIGPAVKVKLLNMALKSEDPALRASALEMLGLQCKNGPWMIGDTDVIDAATSRLADNDPEVRQTAVWVIRLAATPDQRNAAVPLLAKLVGEKDVAPAMQAAMALDEIGAPAAKPAVPGLIAGLKHANSEVQLQCVVALSRLVSADNGDAVPDLIRILTEHKQPYARQEAARALGGIGHAARPAIDALTAATKSKEYGVAKVSTDALAKIKAAPEPKR